MKIIILMALSAMLAAPAFANSKTDWDNLTPAQQRAVEKSALADNAKRNPFCRNCHGGPADNRDDLRYDNDGDLIESSR